MHLGVIFLTLHYVFKIMTYNSSLFIFTAKHYSTAWRQHTLSTHSNSEEHLSCFQIWAIMNPAARNNFVQILPLSHPEPLLQDVILISKIWAFGISVNASSPQWGLTLLPVQNSIISKHDMTSGMSIRLSVLQQPPSPGPRKALPFACVVQIPVKVQVKNPHWDFSGPYLHCLSSLGPRPEHPVYGSSPTPRTLPCQLS